MSQFMGDDPFHIVLCDAVINNDNLFLGVACGRVGRVFTPAMSVDFYFSKAGQYGREFVEYFSDFSCFTFGEYFVVIGKMEFGRFRTAIVFAVCGNDRRGDTGSIGFLISRPLV